MAKQQQYHWEFLGATSDPERLLPTHLRPKNNKWRKVYAAPNTHNAESSSAVDNGEQQARLAAQKEFLLAELDTEYTRLEREIQRQRERAQRQTEGRQGAAVAKYFGATGGRNGLQIAANSAIAHQIVKKSAEDLQGFEDRALAKIHSLGREKENEKDEVEDYIASLSKKYTNADLLSDGQKTATSQATIVKKQRKLQDLLNFNFSDARTSLLKKIFG